MPATQSEYRFDWQSKRGMEAPLAFRKAPKIAPSNLILYTGDQFPAWKGNVFVGALAGKAVWRFELAGEDNTPRVVRHEALFAELGARIVRVARADSML
ncbi:PQQ-dependent sugar dehydrogenase [Variovorax beijingensis]|uniref:PQQ-dependent sugar dehydrogenase n=1 Tax=Variovorax beijingensis TaxID=2496117 RepID=UPI0023E8C977|nr:PQQ-dependent sugar dehydrogenase [Variovorax beijingensis]